MRRSPGPWMPAACSAAALIVAVGLTLACSASAPLSPEERLSGR